MIAGVRKDMLWVRSSLPIGCNQCYLEQLGRLYRNCSEVAWGLARADMADVYCDVYQAVYQVRATCDVCDVYCDVYQVRAT